jgi:hypothetical protein
MHQHDNGPQAAREKKQKLRRADTAAGFPSTLALFTPYLGLCPDKVVDSSFTNAMPSTSSSNHPELECLFTLAEQYCANHQAHHRDEHILCSEDSAYLDTVTGHELNLQRTSILVVGHYAEDQVIRFIRLAPHHLLMYLPCVIPGHTVQLPEQIEAYADQASVHFAGPGYMDCHSNLNLHFFVVVDGVAWSPVVLFRNRVFVFCEMRPQPVRVDPPIRDCLVLDGVDHRYNRTINGVCQHFLHVEPNGVPTIVLQQCNLFLTSVDFNSDHFAMVFDRVRNNVASVPEEMYQSWREATYKWVARQRKADCSDNSWILWFECASKFIHPSVSCVRLGQIMAEFAATTPRAVVVGLVGLLCVVFTLTILSVFWFAELTRLLMLPLSGYAFVVYSLVVAPFVEEILVISLEGYFIADTVWIVSHLWNPGSLMCRIPVVLMAIVRQVIRARHDRRDCIRIMIVIHLLWNVAVFVAAVIANQPTQVAPLRPILVEPVFVAKPVLHIPIDDEWSKISSMNFKGAGFNLYEKLDLARDSGGPVSRPRQHSYTAPEYDDTCSVVRDGSICLRRLHREFYGREQYCAAPAAILWLATLLWMIRRLGIMAAGRHFAFCCCAVAHRKYSGLRAKCMHTRCRPSEFFQIGPDLPFHHPLLYAPCTHNLSYGVANRMMSSMDTSCEPVSVDFLLDKRYAIDQTPLTWDLEAYLVDKPAGLVRRARSGLASLLAKGAYILNKQLFVPYQNVIGSRNGRVGLLNQMVSLFNKREFYDYEPFVDKPPKPRIISSCSDEILAWLGPYMSQLSHKVDKLPGVVKQFCAHDLSERAHHIRSTASQWHKHVVAYDMNSFDRSQGLGAMDIQHKLYALFGMPRHVVQFLTHYDSTWMGEVRDADDRKRIFTFTSAIGCRKSGDPHTSVGNNLFHWFVVQHFLHVHADCAEYILNGDDFLGCFQHSSYGQLIKHYQTLGLAVTRGDDLEFCGGYFMGADCVFVRDPCRSLFKFGWFHGPLVLGQELSTLKAICVCQSYISDRCPILSSLIDRCHSLCGTAERRYSLNFSQLGSFKLRGFENVRELSPTFSTDVPFDVRVDYAIRFGIMPGLQIETERCIQHLGLHSHLPLLLGRLL